MFFNFIETYASDPDRVDMLDGVITFNVPTFNTDETLITNNLPILQEDGILVYQ